MSEDSLNTEVIPFVAQIMIGRWRKYALEALQIRIRMNNPRIILERLIKALDLIKPEIALKLNYPEMRDFEK